VDRAVPLRCSGDRSGPAAQEIWRSYRGRADCQNRITELTYDFAAESFCLKDFLATEACLNVAMLAYNLMSLFPQAALKVAVIGRGTKDVHQTLKPWATNSSARPVTLLPLGARIS